MTLPTTSVTPRWWRYLKRRRLLCPVGHHLPETANFPESGFIRCQHWINDGRSKGYECGKWIFLFAIRGGGTIVAEVELKEMRQMEELATPTAMLDFLQILR